MDQMIFGFCLNPEWKINSSRAIHQKFTFFFFPKDFILKFSWFVFLYFVKKYYSGLEMIQKVSCQEPYIQALQKALNYWNKIILEDHNECLQWRLCWANPWTSLTMSIEWSVYKLKLVNTIYFKFERPLTAAIKKLSSHGCYCWKSRKESISISDQFSLLQNPKSRVWQVSVLRPMFRV